MGESAKRYLPAFLDLDGRLAVVVGSGSAAERKARQLARYGADVVVVSADPSRSLLEAEAEGVLTVESRDYVRGDLQGAALVHCFVDDAEVRRAVVSEARAAGCPINVADAPELSSFLVPGVVHRGPLQIAVSTGGLAPQIARRIRRRLAEEFGAEWGACVSLLREVRAIAAERLEDPAAVDAVLVAVAESNLAERLAGGQALSAAGLFEEFAPKAAARDAAPDAPAVAQQDAGAPQHKEAAR